MVCTIEGCDSPVRVKSRGLCLKHYTRWHRYGDTSAVKSRWDMGPEGRFWANVEKTETCWLWHGYRRPDGYGRISIAKKHIPVHRYSYELLVGAIPEGLHIDHLCKNPSCVNPQHLEPVTPAENAMRGEGIATQHARQTHCAHGHPYDEVNTRLVTDKKGRVGRRCRTCERRHSREAYARRRAAAINANPGLNIDVTASA